MHNQVKISIIIPVYNVEKYLRRSLDCVKNQTWKNLEVLLLDDASTDNSGVICDEYAREDLRFVVYHLAHCGVAEARNFALERFTGECFMFVDADDMIAEQYVERLYHAMMEKGADVATCLEHCDHDPDLPSYEYTGKKKAEWKYLEDYDFTKKWSHRTVWGAIFKKEVLQDLRFRPEYHCSTDTLFFAELLERIKKVVYIDEKLYCYICYDESVYHGEFNEKRYSEILVWERVAGIFQNMSEMAYISSVTNVVRYCYIGANRLLSQKPFNQELYDQLTRHVRGREDIVAKSTFGAKTKQELIFFCKYPERYQELKQSSYAPHVWILGGIDHGNLGDHQIVMSMEECLRDMMPDIVFHEIPLSQYFEKKKYLLDAVGSNDVLLFIGGGNLGTLWPRTENLRRDAIVSWPDNPKIIFPQSVFFEDSEDGRKELEISKKAYAGENCLLALRDEISYQTASENFSCRLFLTPDMVLYSDIQIPKVKREDCLLLMRSDKEGNLNDADYDELSKCLQAQSLKVQKDDTVVKKEVGKSGREKALREMLEKVSSSRLVVTDRLHGLIFSAITGTPCIAFPNNHHKIQASMQWLGDLPYIKFISSIREFDTAFYELDLDQSYQYPVSEKRELFAEFKSAVEDVLTNARVKKQSNPCKVSVVIPVYNVEAYLGKCLDSVIGQTLQEIEIICVNDGSSDNSPAILQEYASRDSRIRIIHQENRGLSGARNSGMQCANGKYLYFLDSDDYIRNNALEKMYEKMEEMQLDLLCFNVKPFSDDKAFERRMEFLRQYYKRKRNYPGLYSGNELMQLLWNRGDYLVPVWLHCYRTEFLKETDVRFVEGIYHEDNSFTFECMTKAKRAGYLSDVLYFRYVRPDSITTIRSNFRHAYGYFSCAMHMLDWIRGAGQENEYSSLYHIIINDTFRASREVYQKLSDEEKKRYLELPPNEQNWFYALIRMQKELDDQIFEYQSDISNQQEELKQKEDQINHYRRLLADYLARIDLKIFDSEEPSELEIVSVSDQNAVITEPAWFGKDGKGIVTETAQHTIDIKTKCGTKGNLRIRLRATDVKGDDGTRIPHWIDYTSLSVNGKEYLKKRTPSWHDKPITVMIPAEAGDVMDIHVGWDRHVAGRKAQIKRRIKSLLQKP